MCCCGQPTINGQPGYRWQPNDPPSVRRVHPPVLNEHSTLIFDEPGRCGGIDCHCHHFCVVKDFSFYKLLVMHGGGQEEVRLSTTKTMMDGMAAMDSNTRFWFLHAIYRAYSNGKQEASEKESQRWTRAAAEKRIKTRRVRGTHSVKVWIEPKIEPANNPA